MLCIIYLLTITKCLIIYQFNFNLKKHKFSTFVNSLKLTNQY